MLTYRILLDPNDDDEPTMYFPMWENKIFMFFYAFALFLDTMFCYIPILDDKMLVVY